MDRQLLKGPGSVRKLQRDEGSQHRDGGAQGEERRHGRHRRPQREEGHGQARAMQVPPAGGPSPHDDMAQQVEREPAEKGSSREGAEGLQLGPAAPP